MNGYVGKIVKRASEWRDRYRPVIVALLLGSGLADDPQKQRDVRYPIEPKKENRR
jgi:hypothetical protein